MNEETRTVLIKRFEKIIGKLATIDYIKSNTNKQGKFYKKHKPYTLSIDVENAKELYDILFFDNSFNAMTREEEEKIKGYLLLNREIWQSAC